MKTAFQIIVASLIFAVGTLAQAQSYTMPGNDPVREHTHVSEELIRFCQRNPDHRSCIAIWPRVPAHRGHVLR